MALYVTGSMPMADQRVWTMRMKNSSDGFHETPYTRPGRSKIILSGRHLGDTCRPRIPNAACSRFAISSSSAYGRHVDGGSLARYLGQQYGCISLSKSQFPAVTNLHCRLIFHLRLFRSDYLLFPILESGFTVFEPKTMSCWRRVGYVAVYWPVYS